MNWDKLFLDIADAILMGIPSAALAPQLAGVYDIEVEDAMKLVNELTRTYEGQLAKTTKTFTKAQELYNAWQQTGKIGKLATVERLKLLDAGKQNAKAEDDLAKTKDKLDQASRTLEEAERVRDYKKSSLGHLTMGEKAPSNTYEK